MGPCLLLVAILVMSTADGQYTAVTYNAGLFPRVPSYKDRAEVLVSKLRQSSADVVCLQEVWFGEEVRKLQNELQTIFPYAISKVTSGPIRHHSIRHHHRRRSRPPCSLGSLRQLLRCSRRECSEATTEVAKLICAASKCRLMALKQTCITCLVLTGSPENFVQECWTTRPRQVNVPGLLLLSKRPLQNEEVVDFEPNQKQLLPRSYIQTDVAGIGKVICAHLSANLGPVYFEPNLKSKYTSWSAQNLDEVQHLTSTLEGETRVVLMGDLNTGPTVGDAVADFTESYGSLTTAGGFVSPYVETVGQCTYCVTNPFVQGHWPVSLLIDHVMLRGFHGTSAQRIFDTNIEGQEFPMSDHYGIQVTFDEE